MAIDNAVVRQELQQDAAYLNYLPLHLRERYTEGLHDAQLTHLRRQIALLDVRIKLLLEELDNKILTPDKIAEDIQEKFPKLDAEVVKEVAAYVNTLLPDGHIGTRTYRSLERLVSKYEIAMAGGRLIQADQALRQLFAAIRSGRRDDETWKEIETVMDSRRKLVEAEERRVVASQQTLTTDRVVALVSLAIYSLQEAVKRHEPDREVQTNILLEAERIYASNLGGESNHATYSVGVD